MSARKRLCTRRDARAHGAIVSGNRPAFDADIRRMTLRAGQDPAGVFDTETASDLLIYSFCDEISCGFPGRFESCSFTTRKNLRAARGEVRDGSVSPPQRW